MRKETTRSSVLCGRSSPTEITQFGLQIGTISCKIVGALPEKKKGGGGVLKSVRYNTHLHPFPYFVQVLGTGSRVGEWETGVHGDIIEVQIKYTVKSIPATGYRSSGVYPTKPKLRNGNNMRRYEPYLIPV